MLNTKTSTNFTKIHGLDKRNPADTGMLYSHGGAEAGTASFCKCYNIHSTDPAAIVAHARGQFRTMGFCFLYAVKGSSVVALMKRGHFAQRDVRRLVDDGYTEFFYNLGFACSVFMLPSGEIVEVDGQIDCSPAKTTSAAVAMGRAMGVL